MMAITKLQRAMKVIKDNPGLTYLEYAQSADCSENTVTRAIREMNMTKKDKAIKIIRANPGLYIAQYAEMVGCSTSTIDEAIRKMKGRKPGDKRKYKKKKIDVPVFVESKPEELSLNQRLLRAPMKKWAELVQ